jgi:hypothetical protein
LKDVLKSLESLRASEAALRQKWEGTKSQLDDFDRQNSTILDGLRQLLNQAGGEGALADYRSQLALLEKDKDTAYARREALKKQLTGL